MFIVAAQDTNVLGGQLASLTTEHVGKPRTWADVPLDKFLITMDERRVGGKRWRDSGETMALVPASTPLEHYRMTQGPLMFRLAQFSS